VVALADSEDLENKLARALNGLDPAKAAPVHCGAGWF
jgi:hypothetical protein